MAESFIPVGGTQKSLETVELLNTEGSKVHREAVYNGSPTNFDAQQEVDEIPQAARVILYDEDGNAFSTTNPIPTDVSSTVGLTDDELRASPVPVSGPLTDTELRASSVPVVGPLTDTELRATPVPIVIEDLAGNTAGIVKTQDNYALLTSDRATAGSRFSGFGEASISGAQDNYDIWEGPTNAHPGPVTAGFQPNLVSTSTSDTAGGTGCRAMHVFYLDTAGLEQDEVVIMNGTTQVSMVATDVMFINRMHTDDAGSAGTCVGTVDARNVAVVHSRVSAAGNQTLQAIKMVPADKYYFVSGWHCEGVVDGSNVKQIAKMRIRTTSVLVQEGELPLYHFIDVTKVKDTSSGWLPFPNTLRIEPLAIIKVSAWTTGTIDVSASFTGWLEDVI